MNSTIEAVLQSDNKELSFYLEPKDIFIYGHRKFRAIYTESQNENLCNKLSEDTNILLL